MRPAANPINFDEIESRGGGERGTINPHRIMKYSSRQTHTHAPNVIEATA
jgi:hypothetical protein